jgi:hypothetical protein
MIAPDGGVPVPDGKTVEAGKAAKASSGATREAQTTEHQGRMARHARCVA